jgi:hypothetical protein
MSAIFAKKESSSSGGQVTANLADVITAIGWGADRLPSCSAKMRRDGSQRTIRQAAGAVAEVLNRSESKEKAAMLAAL